MKQYVGLDVSDEEASVCVIDEDGVVAVEAKVPSEPEAIAEFLGREAPHAVKVGFETGPLSTWHWHELTDLGVPAICIDARHAKGALSCRINKTDRNDAVGIARIIRMGWYREVKVKSYASHHVRSSLRARSLLIKTRCNYENQIRGFLKTFGFRIGNTASAVRCPCRDGGVGDLAAYVAARSDDPFGDRAAHTEAPAPRRRLHVAVLHRPRTEPWLRQVQCEWRA